MRVVGGSVDHMIFTVPIVHREAHRERLHVLRLGVRLGVGLAGLRNRFCADHVVGSGKREQVAQLGRVGKAGRAQHDCVTVGDVHHAHSAHAIMVYICTRGLVVQQHPQPSAMHVRRQHVLQHSQRGARFTSDA